MSLYDVITGDALTVLRTMEAESVNCCVTSPPYYALRDYGTASWDGGEVSCDHKQGRNGSGRADGVVDVRGQRNRDGVGSMGGDCQKCGARRIDSQLGLEETPDAYIAAMVAVFAEVRRVLRPDATLWVNAGDSYSSQAGQRKPTDKAGIKQQLNVASTGAPSRWAAGCKPKDMIGIPWMLAFALRADGWYLRSDIIWAKPNPMPGSQQDRPTSSYEHLFLLARSERYYYDNEAIKEPASSATTKTPDGWDTGDGTHGAYHRNGREKGKPTSRDNFRRSNGKVLDVDVPGQTCAQHREDRGDTLTTGFREKRDVWTVPTCGFSEAHFATYPPDLIRPCIRAGCPAGGLVLDPFTGSGTTGLVALEEGRRFIGIELNPEYAAMACRRIGGARLALELEGVSL